MTKSKIKTTTVTFEEFTDMEFSHPASWWVRSCLGDYTYFHCRNREDAQKICDDMFSKGHYKVNAAKMSKPPESQSAVGRLNSRSRAGSRSVK